MLTERKSMKNHEHAGGFLLTELLVRSNFFPNVFAPFCLCDGELQQDLRNFDHSTCCEMVDPCKKRSHFRGTD